MAGGPQPIGEGGGPNPPYGEDFFNRIVGVHWPRRGVIGENLAVEFSDSPSYLTSGINLSLGKATISFWFRIPADTVEKARAANPGGYWEYSVFQGVIPLVTWGRQQTTPVTDLKQVDTGAIVLLGPFGEPIQVWEAAGAHQAPMQPSCIGVYAGFPGDDSPGGKPVLDVHILTDVHASGSGLYLLPIDFTGEFIGINQNPGPNFGKPVYTNVEYIMGDFSYTITEEPEYFGNHVYGSVGPEVTVNEWHHLLISWDLGSGISKMWCALDNVNKDGNALPAINDSTMGPNDHVSQTIWLYGSEAGAEFSSNSVLTDPVQVPGPPTASRATNDSGGATTVNPVATVEMAELQVFVGVALDTRSESNRRAFIDCKRDLNGDPVGEGANNLVVFKPVDPATAAKLIGKKPEILLHGSGNWIKGVNLGTAGHPKDFTPVMPIVEYLPNPSLPP